MQSGLHGAKRPDTIPPFTPGGRLTPVSGTPVITSDQASKATVYYTHDQHNKIPIIQNGIIRPVDFPDELILSLTSAHDASGIYDVFGVLHGDRPVLVTGRKWSTVTAGSGARGTGGDTAELTRAGGVRVNKYGMPGLNGESSVYIPPLEGTYLGTILIDSVAGQLTCHTAYGQSRNWGVWNAFNRKPIVMLMGDATASWAYNTGTVRQSRADATNAATILCGLPEERVKIEFNQNVQSASNNASANAAGIGVGWNSTTSFSGNRARVDNINNSATNIVQLKALSSKYVPDPFIGINVANALEFGGADTTTFYGTNSDMQMAVEWLG